VVEEGATLRTLADAATGERVRVRRVEDDDAERLRYLAELGVRPGAMIRILDRAPFDGPITLWVDDTGGGAARAIGPALAAQVFVEPITMT
jgi:DtxR family Mn-dependent transcriptional regulator